MTRAPLLASWLATSFVMGCSSGGDEPPPASSAPDARTEGCVPAAISRRDAKPARSADAPFGDCAAGVFSHCGGGDGERGSYCSIALDRARTEEARKASPDACCYGRN